MKVTPEVQRFLAVAVRAEAEVGPVVAAADVVVVDILEKVSDSEERHSAKETKN